MTNALSTDAIVAAVGAGAMGAGIAQVAAVAGHRVLLQDNPAGPLAWADQEGQANAQLLLSDLNASCGGNRYRISPLIQRQAFQGKNMHG